jgi:hypothetical protein
VRRHGVSGPCLIACVAGAAPFRNIHHATRDQSRLIPAPPPSCGLPLGISKPVVRPAPQQPQGPVSGDCIVTPLARRLRRIEDRRNLIRRIPNVVERYHDETTEAAVARFCHRHGISALPKGHRLLIVTAFRTMSEFRIAIKAQQSELLAMARTVKGQL